ncbi:MAG: hypothetical protein FWG29_09090, partial [Treponema sp.]|nr:hypothetical protein [Treponema sp.]
MSNVPFYYNQYTAKERSYVEYMGEINKSISSEVERNTNKQIAANAAIAGRLASEIDYSMVQMQTGIQTSINRQTSEIIASNNVLTQTYQQGYNELNNTLDIGFSGLSNKLGQMGAAFSLGLDRISDTLKGMSKEICDKLDAIHDIINNPLLTQSRELFRRAIVNYNKGFFEESLEDIQAAVEKYKTDYMSWFLMGKLLAFGTGEFSNVINLEAAINAFTQAAKYNSPNISESTDARLLSVEIYFYLGTTQYAQSNELLRTRKENEASEMLANALKSFEKSFLYSEKMLESLFNIARCKVLLNQKKAALIDLENLILLDRNYCIKAFNDYDFLNISEELIELINKLKHEFFINNTEIKYKKIICLIDELKELNGFYKDHSKIPSNFTENLPYFDIMDYNLKFTAMIPQIEEAIQEQRKKNEKTIQEQRRKNEEAKLKQKEQEFKILKTQELKEPRKKLEKYIDVISAGTFHTVCLKNNGTVVAVGANKNGQCNIDSW